MRPADSRVPAGHSACSAQPSSQMTGARRHRRRTRASSSAVVPVRIPDRHNSSRAPGAGAGFTLEEITSLALSSQPVAQTRSHPSDSSLGPSAGLTRLNGTASRLGPATRTMAEFRRALGAVRDEYPVDVQEQHRLLSTAGHGTRIGPARPAADIRHDNNALICRNRAIMPNVDMELSGGLLIRGRQMNQPGICRAEAARVKVEGSKVGLAVDVQPPPVRRPRLTYGECDHRCADSAALPRAPSLCIEQERVIPTVPRHVHKSDQCTRFFTSTDPAKAVATDLAPPVLDGTPAMGQHEVDHLLVGDRVAPTADDRCFHSASIALSCRVVGADKESIDGGPARSAAGIRGRGALALESGRPGIPVVS